MIELRTPGGTQIAQAQSEQEMYGILRKRKQELRNFPGTFESIEVYDGGRFKSTFRVSSRALVKVC